MGSGVDVGSSVGTGVGSGMGVGVGTAVGACVGTAVGGGLSVGVAAEVDGAVVSPPEPESEQAAITRAKATIKNRGAAQPLFRTIPFR